MISPSIYDEYRVNKQSNLETWEYLVENKGVTGDDLITADSAEPKSVDDYRNYGSFCRPAIKGPDSVRYGLMPERVLLGLQHILIGPVRAADGRVEAFEHNEFRTAAHDGLLHGPDFFLARELVQLLKPQVFEVAVSYLHRGSTKSSFISAEIILGITQDPQANGILFRKVGFTIGTSVFEQCLWAIDALGMHNLWRVWQ